MVTEAITRRATAFHEAGHALVAAALGADVYACWIDGDGCGEVRYQHQFDDGELLSVIFAGKLAEQLAFGEQADAIGGVAEIFDNYDDPQTAHDDLRDVCGDDLDAALLLWEMPLFDRCSTMHDSQTEALALLRGRWPDVEEIAACLGGES